MRNLRCHKSTHSWGSGQTVVEYLLLLSFVALVALKVGLFVRNAFKKGAPELKKVVIEENLNTGIGFK